MACPGPTQACLNMYCSLFNPENSDAALQVMETEPCGPPWASAPSPKSSPSPGIAWAGQLHPLLVLERQCKPPLHPPPAPTLATSSGEGRVRCLDLPGVGREVGGSLAPVGWMQRPCASSQGSGLSRCLLPVHWSGRQRAHRRVGSGPQTRCRQSPGHRLS